MNDICWTIQYSPLANSRMQNIKLFIGSEIFFSFIFAVDDSQPLGISILQQTAVSFLAVPQMA